jgi:hypothetical protein
MRRRTSKAEFQTAIELKNEDTRSDIHWYSNPNAQIFLSNVRVLCNDCAKLKMQRPSRASPGDWISPLLSIHIYNESSSFSSFLSDIPPPMIFDHFLASSKHYVPSNMIHSHSTLASPQCSYLHYNSRYQVSLHHPRVGTNG